MTETTASPEATAPADPSHGAADGSVSDQDARAAPARRVPHDLLPLPRRGRLLMIRWIVREEMPCV